MNCGPNIKHHQINVHSMLSKPECTLRGVPPKHLFAELHKAVSQGQGVTDGFSLPSCNIWYTKAVKMCWCLQEALRMRLLEKVASPTMSCSCLLRDERHARCHIRVRVGDLVQGVYSTFLGQARNHVADAIGINEATIEVIKSVCTRFDNAPNDAVVKPHFEEALFLRLCKSVEAVAVDSAENEVVAVTDMQNMEFFPKRVFVLRDLPHGARRLLSRLWKADDVLNDCFGFFCHWNVSPANIIDVCAFGPRFPRTKLHNVAMV